MSAFTQEQLLLRQQAQAAGTLEYPLNSAVQFPVLDLFLHRLHRETPEAVTSADNVGVGSEASGQVLNPASRRLHLSTFRNQRLS